MSGRLVCASLLALLLVASADAYSLVACPKYTVRSSEPTARSAVRSLMYPFQPNSFPDHPAHENLANEREERAVSMTSKCGYVSVPQDHANPTGAQTNLYVKCYTSAVSTGLMWVLQGGPGASSIAMESIMAAMYESLNGDYDVCTLDFRGVFRSSRLDCPATGYMTPGSPDSCAMASSEEAPCRSEIASYHVTTYTSTQGAKDLEFLIDNYPTSKAKVAIYGTSYGTFWMFRFAQLFPTRPYMYIADSVANPIGPHADQLWFNDFDVNADPVMRSYLAACSADDFCSTYLTADAVEYANRTLTKVLKNNGCPALTDKFSGTDIVRLLYSTFASGYFSRPAFPAILYRMNRCRAADVTFIERAMNYTNPLPPTNTLCTNDFTQTIYLQVIFSDMWENITRAQIEAREEGLLFNIGAALDLYDTKQNWAGTNPDHVYNGVNPAQSGKWLVLGGTFDAQTPERFAKTFYDNLSATNKYYGKAVGSPHVVVGSSATLNAATSTCGIAVVTDFIVKNGVAEPTMGCLASLETVDFKGDSSYNVAVFDTNDLFDGAGSFVIDPIAAFISAVVLGFCTFTLLIVTCALGYHVKTSKRSSVAP